MTCHDHKGSVDASLDRKEVKDLSTGVKGIHELYPAKASGHIEMRRSNEAAAYCNVIGKVSSSVFTFEADAFHTLQSC